MDELGLDRGEALDRTGISSELTLDIVMPLIVDKLRACILALPASGYCFDDAHGKLRNLWGNEIFKV